MDLFTHCIILHEVAHVDIGYDCFLGLFSLNFSIVLVTAQRIHLPNTNPQSHLKCPTASRNLCGAGRNSLLSNLLFPGSVTQRFLLQGTSPSG